MTKAQTLFYLAIVALLVIGWGSLAVSPGRAEEPLVVGITDTPTPTATAPPPPTDTFTPTPPPTTPPPGPTEPPSSPPPPGEPSDTPTPAITPILPLAGQADPTPLWLLLVVAGGLLVLWAWLLRRSSTHLL